MLMAMDQIGFVSSAEIAVVQSSLARSGIPRKLALFFTMQARAANQTAMSAPG
jgi:hypothetical protein